MSGRYWEIKMEEKKRPGEEAPLTLEDKCLIIKARCDYHSYRSVKRKVWEGNSGGSPTPQSRGRALAGSTGEGRGEWTVNPRQQSPALLTGCATHWGEAWWPLPTVQRIGGTKQQLLYQKLRRGRTGQGFKQQPPPKYPTPFPSVTNSHLTFPIISFTSGSPITPTHHGGPPPARDLGAHEQVFFFFSTRSLLSRF